MSLQAIVDLSRELHRLAIAGTDLAIGDRRIADLVPALEKSGTRAPVFATIAERANALIGSDRAGAAARFLRLNVLVRAVLTAQGRGDVEGELEPPAPAAMSATNLSARAVQALAERIRSGDARALDDPAARERFADLRLMAHAVDALDADNAQVANTAAERFVPLYGAAVVPLLTARLDPSAKRPAARIVGAVAAADADSGARLARRILDPDAGPAFALPAASGEASDEARAAALRALGPGDADRALLRDALGARKKALRLAASARLVELGDAAATARCVELLGGPLAKAREAIDALVGAPEALRAPAVRDALRALGDRLFEAARDGVLSRADADLLHEVLRLSFVGAAGDDGASLALARAAFDGFHASRRAEHDHYLLHAHHPGRWIASTVERLVRDLPDDEALDVAGRAMGINTGAALAECAVRFGPDEAWRRFERASLSGHRRQRGLLFAFADLHERDPSSRALRLPPPERWGVEWMKEALRHGNIDLAWYLHRSHPGSVVEWARGSKEPMWIDFVMLVLTIDPDAAPWLRDGIGHRSSPGDALREPLCRAVGARDARACAAVLDALGSELAARPGGAGARIRALRERLTEHTS